MRSKWIVLIIISVFLATGLFTILTISHIPVWDEAVYLGMGKYIYSSGQSGLLENIRPIGLPLITGFFWKIGLNQIIASQIVELLFALGIIILTYLIASILSDKKTAIIASALVAITPIILIQSLNVLTEIPSTFFVLLAIYMFLTKRYLLAGLFSGIAFLFKFVQGLIVISFLIAIILNYTSKKRTSHRNVLSRYILGAVIIVVIIISFNYYNYQFGNPIDSIIKPFIAASWYQNNVYQNVASGTLSSDISYILYYILLLLQENILLIFGLIPLFLPRYWKDNNRIVVVSLSLYLIYLTAIPYKQDRFAILMIPLLAILSSQIIYKAYETIRKSKYRKIIAIIVMVAVVVTVHSIYCFVSNTEQLRSTDYDDFKQYYAQDLKGIIITTDPLFSLYSNAKFIPYYDISKEDPFVNPWERNYKFDALIYSESSFPCLNTTATSACIHKFIESYDIINTKNISFRTRVAQIYIQNGR